MSIINGTTAGDTLYGTGGNDIITAEVGNEVVYGGTGTNLIYGNLGADTLIAGPNNDTIYGAQGNDSIAGGTGNSILSGGYGSDTMVSSSGSDTMHGGTGNNLLVGGSGNDSMVGSVGNDTIIAGSGNSILHGGDGNDSLVGGIGNDTLDGGRGFDTLTGGSGQTTFVIEHLTDVTSNIETITNFNPATNTIDITGFHSTITQFSDLASDIVQSGNNTIINLSSTQQVVLQNFTGTLTAANFIGLGQQVFNVDNFGAHGDGVTDDTSAIQAAVNAASKAGGGIVYLPTGTYIVSGNGDPTDGCIELPSNITLEGSGIGATTLKVANGYSSDITGIVRTPVGVPTDNVTVENLTINGNQQTAANPNGATGGRIFGFFCGTEPTSPLFCSNITVNNVEAENNSGYGFDPHAQTYNLVMSNDISHNNGFDGFVSDHQTNAVYENDVAYNNVRHGFNIVTSSSNVSLINDTAYSNGGDGVAVQRGSTDIPWPVGTVVQGGSYHNNGLAGVLMQMASYTTVTGANIYGNATQGVLIYGGSNNDINSNTIQNDSQSKNSGFDEVEIRAYNDTGVTGNIYDANNNIITGNTISSSGAIMSRYSVHEDADGSNYNAVWNNLITASHSGSIFLSGANSTTSDPNAPPITVTTSTGIVINGTSKAQVITDTNNGNDTINGNGVGHGENDTIYGGTGNDLIIAGIGNNFLYGGAGNDTIYGASASGTIHGNNTIYGGAGADVLYGGTGANKFQFSAISNNDVIMNFKEHALGGSDAMEITSDIYSTPNIAFTHVIYSGGNAFVDLGHGNNIELVGITANSLIRTDFQIISTSQLV